MIKELFQKDIARAINGVVKADQLDDASVWQELDEYVITKELDTHFRRFFEAFNRVADGRDSDAAGQIGVWISGFFGSGKSHFLKILGYLLANREVTQHGQTRRALDFFRDKVQDPLLFADMQRAIAPDEAARADVMLFNIESKAGADGGRAAILKVFLNVFNEALGFSSDFPHLAAIERQLKAQGKLSAFHDAFAALTGNEWQMERDKYEFLADEIVAALSQVTGQSPASCRALVENSAEQFTLSPEKFAQWVREYLQSQPKEKRILFLVDEVGQFIGSNTDLMLSLQTITENLGTACNGRAWVVVTSQENVEAVLGEKVESKTHDFSKIQGRFHTRLSLSSANTDEVIQHRLLEKTIEAEAELCDLWARKGDVLNNQISFNGNAMTFKKIEGAASFAANYPFVPYQFQLMQRVFEEIRTHGASGLHISRGERSMLEAFQIAAQSVGESTVGTLVPLYRFYPSLENFLDTGVRRTIEQAHGRGLHDFDIEVLRTLFLIRYLHEFKGNIDNLTTLCIDQIDADRVQLRADITASLGRLESETLIGRNGNDYFFLTNEERDISREIKQVELQAGDAERKLAKILFEEVLGNSIKHRFPDNKKDFSFNRDCDEIPYGSQFDAAELRVSVLSPLFDDYALFDTSRCILESGQRVLVKLENDGELERELKLWLRTYRYIALHSDPTSQSTAQTILRERGSENFERAKRLRERLEKLFLQADFFVDNQTRDISAATPALLLGQMLDFLIRNSFSKLGLLAHLKDDPLRELRAVLAANDTAQLSMEMKSEHANALAHQEVAQFIDLSAAQNREIVLGELVARYEKRPYGWPEWETVLIVARLQVLGGVAIVLDGAIVAPQNSHEILSKSNKRMQIRLQKRRTLGGDALQEARQLGQNVFSQNGPESEDALAKFLRARLEEWNGHLREFDAVESNGRYPGGAEIERALAALKALLSPTESATFIENFLTHKTDLLDLRDDYDQLHFFYTRQKTHWDELHRHLRYFEANRSELESDATIAAQLAQLREIARNPHPYSLLKNVDAPLQTVRDANNRRVEERRAQANQALARAIESVESELNAARIEGTARGRYLQALRDIERDIKEETSIGNLVHTLQRIDGAKDRALDELETVIAPKPNEQAGVDVPTIKARVVIEAKDSMGKAYLENEDDVEKFLGALRERLSAAIASGQRIEIR